MTIKIESTKAPERTRQTGKNTEVFKAIRSLKNDNWFAVPGSEKLSREHSLLERNCVRSYIARHKLVGVSVYKDEKGRLIVQKTK